MNPWLLWCFLAALIGLGFGLAIGIRQRRALDVACLTNCHIEIQRRNGTLPLDDPQARVAYEEQCG